MRGRPSWPRPSSSTSPRVSKVRAPQVLLLEAKLLASLKHAFFATESMADGMSGIRQSRVACLRARLGLEAERMIRGEPARERSLPPIAQDLSADIRQCGSGCGRILTSDRMPTDGRDCPDAGHWNRLIGTTPYSYMKGMGLSPRDSSYREDQRIEDDERYRDDRTRCGFDVVSKRDS